jgi:hypothetical protein
VIERVLENMSVHLAKRTTRRSFLGRLGAGMVAITGGSFVASAISAQKVEAYHICGHLYTTNSCPHPFKPLSRVDKYGYPVHPKHGYPVDDYGELYTSRGQKRSKMCEELVARKYPKTGRPRYGGGWSRCCNGRVRRIADCCSYSDTRINGDASVTGYCYRGTKVFCIGYRDLNVRC